MEMREKILTFIEKNSRVDLKDLAVMLGTEEAVVANELAAMEEEHIICGYHTLIDWEKTSMEKVNALIEVRVTPQRGRGFDSVAERVYNYPEVNAVYLISGGYDLLVTLDGKSLKARWRSLCPISCQRWILYSAQRQISSSRNTKTMGRLSQSPKKMKGCW